MSKTVTGLAILVLLLGGGFLVVSNRQTPSRPTPASTVSQEDQPTEQFSNPKKSAHYESNTPEHGSTLAGVPINVVINFNFDLAPPSSISVTSDGKEYGVGETIIDSNKLTLRRNLDPNSPDGLYTVNYNACWPDKNCHDGSFQFKIDRKQASQFEDMTSKKEVTVKLSEIKFIPANLKISKGTKVTWVNDDEEEHFINTDSHPHHTYLIAQNSKALKKGDQYSYTFEKVGIYPYHCSAHEASMKGNILVE